MSRRRLEQLLGVDPELGGGLVVGALDRRHRPLQGLDQGDVVVVVGLRLELARRRRLDRGGQRLGALLHLQVHVDLEQGQGRQLAHRLRAGLLHQRLQRAVQAELGVGRRGDREPEVEVVGAQVVVRDAGVGVDRLRRPLRVLGVDFGGDQHRLVAERAGVEDRRDLADDPAVEQPLGAGEDVVELEPRLGGDQRERLRVEREVRLQQVHQLLVGLVERDRRAALAGARLRLRDVFTEAKERPPSRSR